MRITALLILLVSLSFMNALVGSLGLFVTQPEMFGSEFIQTVNETANDQSYIGSSVQAETTTFGVGDFIAGLFTFIKIFAVGLVLPYQILMGFGINEAIALAVTFPVYLIYIIAIIQFLSGRFIE